METAFHSASGFHLNPLIGENVTISVLLQREREGGREGEREREKKNLLPHITPAKRFIHHHTAWMQAHMCARTGTHIQVRVQCLFLWMGSTHTYTDTHIILSVWDTPGTPWQGNFQWSVYNRVGFLTWATSLSLRLPRGPSTASCTSGAGKEWDGMKKSKNDQQPLLVPGMEQIWPRPFITNCIILCAIPSEQWCIILGCVLRYGVTKN